MYWQSRGQVLRNAGITYVIGSLVNWRLHFLLYRHTYSPNIVCSTTEMKSIVLRPNLSERKPLKMPPVATPTKKNISATFFKYSLSHTKFHSDIQVLPKLSVPLNSHSKHFRIAMPVVVATAASSSWLLLRAFFTSVGDRDSR